MSEALKRCPFCGGAAEVGEIQESIHDKGPQFYYVSCSLCGTETCESDTKSGAYSHWNTRAELSALKVGQGEAVARMVISPSGYPEKCTASDPEGFPVYRAAPPAAADAVSVPRELLIRLTTYAKYDHAAADQIRALLAQQEVKS